MSGWIKLHRCIQNNHLWDEKPFDRARAWIDLILLANFKDGYLRVRGLKFDVKRGEVGWSILSLSNKWGWSRGKVTRFLNELETEQQIVQQKNHVTSLIVIENYDLYQADDTTEDTADRATDGQQTDTKKKLKNKKKENLVENGSNWLDDFQLFWDAFDYKKGRGGAEKSWRSIGNQSPTLVGRILKAAEQEAMRRPMLLSRGSTPKMAQGWLTERRWEDEAPMQKTKRIQNADGAFIEVPE